MLDITDTARSVSTDWPALVGTLPKALADAIAVYDEAGYAEGPDVGIDASKITTKNVSQTTADLAEVLAAEDKFNEAKLRVRRVLARSVLHTAGAAVPEVIETIRPVFERAVSEYAEAVEALPDEISSSALVDAGPEVLGAYQTAIAAVAVISRVDSWLAGLSNLPAYAGRNPEPALRVLNPTTRAELQAMVNAQGATNPDLYLQRLNPLYVKAVREGIEFQMHTPVETAKLRADIESAQKRTKGIAAVGAIR
jgi:hypothetical protein